MRCPCDECGEIFPSPRAVAMHKRNQECVAANAAEAAIAARVEKPEFKFDHSTAKPGDIGPEKWCTEHALVGVHHSPGGLGMLFGLSRLSGCDSFCKIYTLAFQDRSGSIS